MDKDHVSSIAISEILDKLGFRPHHLGENKALYLSPFSKQKAPAFWVYFKNNHWYDYSIRTGGKLTDFASRYLKFTGEDHMRADALRWIRNLSKASSSRHAGSDINPASALQIRSIDEIRFVGLARYLDERGIPLLLAKRFMKQLKVFNPDSGRTFLALGVKNENEGYLLHNPLFNGSIHPGGITFFRGTNPTSRQIHVFKNIFDFLSVLAHLNRETWEHDTVILHESSNVVNAAPYIKSYGYKALYSWMDNDKAGRQAAMLLNKLLKTEPTLRYIKMNRMYAPHKNVSEWHRNNLPLKGI